MQGASTEQILKACGLWALGGLAFFFAGCASYSGIVHARCRKWEAKQSWSSTGMRTGCEPIAQGQGDVALLMVHGFGDNPAVWKPMMRGFAANGYHCRAMLLPGCGDRLEVRKQVTGDAWQAALSGEVKKLRATHRHVWIVAHSLGCAISIWHVLDNPQSAEGLILLAPLVEVSPKRSPLLSARTWHRLFGHAVSINETPFAEDLLQPPPADRPEVERFNTPNINDALFALLDDINPHAEELRLPLFLAVSPRDHVACPKAAEAWFQRAGNSPNRKLYVATKSAHVIPLDYDADEIVREAGAFIRASRNDQH